MCGIGQTAEVIKTPVNAGVLKAWIHSRTFMIATVDRVLQPLRSNLEVFVTLGCTFKPFDALMGAKLNQYCRH